MVDQILTVSVKFPFRIGLEEHRFSDQLVLRGAGRIDLRADVRSNVSSIGSDKMPPSSVTVMLRRLFISLLYWFFSHFRSACSGGSRRRQAKTNFEHRTVPAFVGLFTSIIPHTLPPERLPM